MFSPLGSRFNLDFYLKKPTQSSKAQRNGVGQPQKNAFHELETRYRNKIQGHLSDRSWQKNLYNKSVTQLFLDKMSRIYPAAHPAVKISKQYEWNSSTFASMEMSHYLEAIINCRELTPETKEIIQNWLDAERNYLPLAIIIDGWRISNPQILEGVKKSDESTLSKLESMEIKIDEQEKETMAKNLSQQIKNLENGSSLKLLGGKLIHEVRIVITKGREKGTVTIVSHDPASESTLVIKNVDVGVVEDEKFLKELIQAKLSSDTEQQLRKLSENIVEHRDQYTKARQEKNSCPVHAIMKEFKYSFLSAYDTKAEGYAQYKIIKSLMAKQALKSERKHIDPALFRALQAKEKIRSRVIEWIETLNNPRKLQETLEFYQKAFAILDPHFDLQEHSKPLSVAQIAALDKKLTLLVTKSPLLPEEKVKLQKLCSTTETPLPIGIKLKRDAESAITREILDESLAFHSSSQGKATSFLSELSNLPDFIRKPLVNMLWKGKASINDVKSILLSGNVDEKTFSRIVEFLVREELLNSNDVDNLLFERIYSEQFDKEIYKSLLKKLHDSNMLDDNAYNNYLSELTPESTDKRKKKQIESLLTSENVGKNFFSLIKKPVKYDLNYLDFSFYNKILDYALNNIFICHHYPRKSAEEKALDKKYFIKSIKFLLKNEKIRSTYFQNLICTLFTATIIERNEALKLVQFLRSIDQDSKFIGGIKLLLGDEKFISKSIKDALNSKNDQTMIDHLGKVYHYQPDKIVLFFSRLPLINPNDRLVERFFFRLFNLDPKPSLDLKKAILETFTKAQGANLFVSFMDRNLLDPDFITDTAIYDTVENLFKNKKITKETVQQWRSKIEATLEKRKRESESKKRINACEEALTNFDKILGTTS